MSTLGAHPDHIKRVEGSPVDVPPEVLYCSIHGERKLIGWDTIETLHFSRPELWIKVTKIPKYACPGHPECGVAEPPRPQGLVGGNRYDTSVAAEIVVNKYAFHLPVYRQQDLFASSGWVPMRSTLLHLIGSAARLAAPLVDYLKKLVIASGSLGTDDTRVTLVIPRKLSPPADDDDVNARRAFEVLTAAANAGEKSISARYWAYRGITIPINVFDFTVSREQIGPDKFLIDGGFKGTMVCDCYSAYLGMHMRSLETIARAACNAHARRKIFDSRKQHPALADQFLLLYQELYDIEDRARSMSAGERLKLRKREARPVWDRLIALLDSPETERLLPQDAFTKALNYMRNHLTELQVYLGVFSFGNVTGNT